ncbi:MAG: 50S ribosomal protein L25 [Calditrichaeota bacterium]|nr:MAG: 50S ribosomal protein L25 [Calditrichota bacterium]
MSEALLKADVKNVVGKGAARQARREGKIPVVCYSNHTEPESFYVNAREFDALMNRSHTMVKLETNDGREIHTIIRHIQYDGVKDLPIHIDFQVVKLDKEVTIKVPLHISGVSAGQKMGGNLYHPLRDLKVSCLPQNIPDMLNFDVTELIIGDTIHVSDLNFENINILTPGSITAIRVEGKNAEEVDETSDEPVAAVAVEEEEVTE